MFQTIMERRLFWPLMAMTPITVMLITILMLNPQIILGIMLVGIIVLGVWGVVEFVDRLTRV